MLTRPSAHATPFARQGLRFAVFATAAAGLAVACSSSGGGSAGAAAPASAAATAAAPTTAAAAPAASAPAAGGAATSITATETEFKIALSSSTFAAGTYSFKTVNAGQATHALEIDGPGVEDMSTGPVSPGASKVLTVTLQKGSYEIYCPVGNHKSMGMDLHVAVS